MSDSSVTDASGTDTGDASAADAGTVKKSDGGAGPDCPSGAAATWTQVYTQIIEPKCSFCHNAGYSDLHGGGLDMLPNNPPPSMRPYSNLVTQLPKKPLAGANPPYACYQKGMRVVKGNAAMSILYSKVHDATPICGAPEPQAPVMGGPGTAHAPLTQTQLDMIASWINAGAKNN